MKRHKNPAGLVTAKEAAEISNVSKRRILAKIAAGHYPSAELAACNTWFIPRSEVIAQASRGGMRTRGRRNKEIPLKDSSSDFKSAKKCPNCNAVIF